MKPYLHMFFLFICLQGCCITATFGAKDVKIDTHDVEKGIVHISCETSNQESVKVLITKGKERYTYELNGEGRAETYPLQMGNGTYHVGILEKIKGNTYAFVENKPIEVSMKRTDQVFLASMQEINWNSSSAAVQKSTQLIGKAHSEENQFDLVYAFLIKNLTYDYAKIATLKPGYLPDVDLTLSTQKGICYDYSALLAAMIRSQGIPTKLVKGYTKNTDVFHAWNEVKINGQWWIVDTTLDSISLKKKIHFERVKDAADYKKISEF